MKMSDFISYTIINQSSYQAEEIVQPTPSRRSGVKERGGERD